MFTSWLSRRTSVHEATTAAERSAVFRLRYRIYVEEQRRRDLPVDHETRTLCDPEDDWPETQLFYTTDGERMTATLRVVWGSARLRAEGFGTRFELDRFAPYPIEQMAFVGRLVAHATRRGTPQVTVLLQHAYRIGRERGAQLAFCYARVALLPHYLALGYRQYTHAFQAEGGGGLYVPLVLLGADREHLERVHSPLAAVARRFPHDPAIVDFWRERFSAAPRTLVPADAAPSAAVSFDAPEHDWWRIFTAEERDTLLQSGCVIDLPPGHTLIQAGARDADLYILMTGSVAVFMPPDESMPRRMIHAGEVVGEMAYFLGAPRTATVRATAPTSVIVIRAQSLHTWLTDRPALAAKLYHHLARVLATRLQGPAA